MTGRRELLLDAAIEVVGATGVHGLTHRAVDGMADLPAGSTSNYFRTRDALLDALVEYVAEREHEHWERLIAGQRPTTPRQVARTLAAAARDAAGPHRTLTLTRYAMLLEGAYRPSLRGQLLTVGAKVEGWVIGWLEAAGSTRPARDLPVLANFYTGVLLHELASPAPHFDPTDQFVLLAESLLQPRKRARP